MVWGRPGPCLVLGIPLCARVAALRSSALQDQTTLVQNSLQFQLQMQEQQDPEYSASELLGESFTILHASSRHRLPGATDAAWEGDTVRGKLGAFVKDGPQSYRATVSGGANPAAGMSQGEWSTLFSGTPTYNGTWVAEPAGLNVSHIIPAKDGGRTVINANTKTGSLPPDTPLQGTVLAAVPPEVAALPEARVPRHPLNQRWSRSADPAEIQKQPHTSEVLTVAIRKPGTGSPRGGLWGKDNVMGAAAQQVFVPGVGFEGGISGAGGYSSEDQSYHVLYGSNLTFPNESKPVGMGHFIGTIRGEPGKMDLIHLAPTADGGADMTSVRSRTRHVTQEELRDMIVAGNFSLPAGEPEAASTSGLTTTTSTSGPTSTAAGSSTTAAASSTSTAATAGSSTTAATSSTSTAATPESQPDPWGRITSVMGDIGGQQRELLPVGSVRESWAVDVADDISGSVQEALEPMKDLAEELLNASLRMKQDVFSKLNDIKQRTKASRGKSLSDDPGMPAFEGVFHRRVSSALSQWQEFAAEMSNQTKNLSRGLEVAGQKGLARRFERSMNTSSTAVSEFTERMNKAMEEVPGMSMLNPAQVDVILGRMDSGLFAASQRLETFGSSFEWTVQDLVDHVADALSGAGLSPDSVQRAFGKVQHLVTAIQWRVRSASRELISSSHEAIVVLCRKASLPAPEWPPRGAAVGSTDAEGVEEGVEEAAAAAGETQDRKPFFGWWGAAGRPGPGVHLLVPLGLLLTTAA